MGNAEYSPTFTKVRQEEGAVSHQREWRITSCTQPKQNFLYSHKWVPMATNLLSLQHWPSLEGHIAH